MRFVWGQPLVAVDTHVFRLLWRLGWLRSLDEGKASVEVNTLTPDEFKFGAVTCDGLRKSDASASKR